MLSFGALLFPRNLDFPSFSFRQQVYFSALPVEFQWFNSKEVLKRDSRELNPGPLAPKAIIIPLDHCPAELT